MSSAPRVLISAIALSQPMGGVLRQAIELLPRAALRLHEAGGSLDLLISSAGLPRDLNDRLPDWVGRIPTKVRPHGPLARALSESRAAKKAVALAKSQGKAYDLFHTGHLPAPRINLPLAFMIHDLRDLTPQAPAWRRQAAKCLLPATFNRADAVITVSQTMQSELTRRYIGIETRLHVVRHGSDHFSALPRAQASRAPILCLGHLEARRNPMLLIETLARHPELPPVLFAGASKHNEDRRLHDRAQKLGICDRVRILGKVHETDLPKLFATSACMVIPSKIEGFGIPALEAQRARLPLAVAQAGALPEVSAPGTPMFAPEDPGACAHAITKALKAPKAQIDAAEVFAKSFTWNRAASALFDIWTALAFR